MRYHFASRATPLKRRSVSRRVQSIDDTAAVLTAMHANEVISRDQVIAWMANPNIETRAAVYRLTNVAWDRIRPEIPGHQQCGFMLEYLIDCIRANREAGDYVHSGFEAAWELAAWLKHLHLRGETVFIERTATRLAQLFRGEDAALQNRVETGALEHMLEEPALRPYFAVWADDPKLSAAYARALAWGEAHEAGG